MDISAISTFLDLTKDNEKPEDLGAKATMSDKKPQDFKQWKSYTACICCRMVSTLPA